MFFRDPFFHRPRKGGGIENRDYTKHIRWTPIKVTIAALCIAIPYSIIVIAVVSITSIWVAIPFIVLPLLIGAVVWLLYRMAQ